MNLVKRKGQVVYEDLLHELELIEHQVMQENSALAMSMMVLEAKLRDRFHQMDTNLRTSVPMSTDDLLIKDDLSAAEIEALIPRELPAFPESPLYQQTDSRTTLETVGVATLLAMATACGVFGLASALQVIVGWIA
jgi:hypothetical protein